MLFCPDVLALILPGVKHVLRSKHATSGIRCCPNFAHSTPKLHDIKQIVKLENTSFPVVIIIIIVSLITEPNSCLQRSASERRKARRKVNQRFLTAMMDMGIPNEKAELALSETGNVGVEVATEWLFSVPDHVLEKHLASEPNTPVEAAAQNPEDHRVMLPRRVPLQVSNHLCGCVSSYLIHCLYSPWLPCLSTAPVSIITWWRWA